MLHYLRAKLRMTTHRLWPVGPVRGLFYLGFAGAGALFFLADFYFFRRIFHNLLVNPDIPAALLTALAAKLMGLVLLTTFTLVLFSAMVSALSYLYLDDDLSMLLALPIPRARFLAVRTFEAGANASYMVALLLIPVIGAYLSLGAFNIQVFSSATGGLLLYLAVPTSWGICMTVILARFFPARRLHQILTVMTVVMVCLLVILLRLSRPEALLNPASGGQIFDILRSMHLPKEQSLPSTWLAQVVVEGAAGRWAAAGPVLLKLLVLAAASVGAALVLERFWHTTGYTRAQERPQFGKDQRQGFSSRLAGALVRLAPAPRESRAILRRDTLLFMRDPTQWGQLFILAALMVIYLFNVRYLPTGIAPFRIAVSYWNLATLGLIVASVAGRFAFTSVGSEGRAFFASRTLPMGLMPYLWAKFLFTAVPLTAMSALILWLSNRFLQIRGAALWYTLLLAVGASLCLSAMALAAGCMDPVFNDKNPAKAIMSTWGLTYMFLSLIYVGWMLVVSARPIYHYYEHLLGRGAPPDYTKAVLQVALVSALVGAASFYLGYKRLLQLEPS